MFEVKGKVALVTGGAKGIGFETVNELLKNGVKGVTIADIDPKIGTEAIAKLKPIYGDEKILFIETDVADRNSFENAFKKTVEKFAHVDILFNNAGIFDDKNYEKEIAINITGVTHGITLGLEKYLTEHRSGAEAVIVNTASILGVRILPSLPVYSASKSAVAALTLGFGNKIFYGKTKVKVVAVAPGFTQTDILDAVRRNAFTDDLSKSACDLLSNTKTQTVDFVAKNIIKLIQEKPSGTVWISEEEKDLFEFSFDESYF